MPWYTNPAITSLATLALSVVLTLLSNKFPATSAIWQFIRAIITGVTPASQRAIQRNS